MKGEYTFPVYVAYCLYCARECDQCFETEEGVFCDETCAQEWEDEQRCSIDEYPSHTEDYFD